MDRSASWIEESLANAKAYQSLGRQILRIASQSAIDQFKSFLATWMKRQPPGYRDYDQWKGRMGVTNGEAAIKEHLHQSLEHWRLNYGIKGHWRRSKTHNYIDVLDLFRDAEYSKISVTRILDARLPGLGSVREFPKAYGLQVSVFSNDHPPPHVHVDFLDGKPKLRVAWPSLQSLSNARPLSRSERSNLSEYLNLHGQNILRKLRIIFGPTLPPAVA